MKRTSSTLAAAALVTLISGALMAQTQTTATQTVNLSVASVQLIAVSGNMVSLGIDGTSAVAGTNAVGTDTDNSTTYSVTHNGSTPLRITAAIDVAMPSGTSLSIDLATSNGTSAGTVTLGTTAQDVVTGIAKGVISAQSIGYSFSADASAGEFLGSRTVTLTLSN